MYFESYHWLVLSQINSHFFELGLIINILRYSFINIFLLVDSVVIRDPFQSTTSSHFMRNLLK